MSPVDAAGTAGEIKTFTTKICNSFLFLHDSIWIGLLLNYHKGNVETSACFSLKNEPNRNCQLNYKRQEKPALQHMSSNTSPHCLRLAVVLRQQATFRMRVYLMFGPRATKKLKIVCVFRR